MVSFLPLPLLHQSLLITLILVYFCTSFFFLSLLHFTPAFFDSCCSLLPTFNYFSSRSANYRGDLSGLSGPAKVAVAAFCAIGARPSVHSVSPIFLLEKVKIINIKISPLTLRLIIFIRTTSHYIDTNYIHTYNNSSYPNHQLPFH